MMLYISQKHTRHSIPWNSMKTSHGILWFDTGDLSSNKLSKFNLTWRVGSCMVTKMTPFMSPINTSGWRDLKTELGKHGYWNDLFYRIMYQDNMIYANSSTVAGMIYRYVYWNGYQIGDNWDLAVNYNTYRNMENITTDVVGLVNNSNNDYLVTFPGDAGGMETGEAALNGSGNSIDSDDSCLFVLSSRVIDNKTVIYRNSKYLTEVSKLRESGNGGGGVINPTNPITPTVAHFSYNKNFNVIGCEYYVHKLWSNNPSIIPSRNNKYVLHYKFACTKDTEYFTTHFYIPQMFSTTDTVYLKLHHHMHADSGTVANNGKNNIKLELVNIDTGEVLVEKTQYYKDNFYIEKIIDKNTPVVAILSALSNEFTDYFAAGNNVASYGLGIYEAGRFIISNNPGSNVFVNSGGIVDTIPIRCASIPSTCTYLWNAINSATKKVCNSCNFVYKYANNLWYIFSPDEKYIVVDRPSHYGDVSRINCPRCDGVLR